MPDPRLTVFDIDNVAALGSAIEKAVEAHLRAHGMDADVKLICEACCVVMTHHMGKTDAWTAFQLMNHSLNLLSYGVKKFEDVSCEEAARGSRSA